MSFGMIVILGILLVALVVGLFSMLTDPKEVDAEEHKDIIDQAAAGVRVHDKGTLE